MRRFLSTQVCTTLLALGLLLGPLSHGSAAACVGDCDGSGDVTVNELITMVNIALGSALVSTCPAGDADGSGDITVTEIIAAVNNALGMCPLPQATPTPTEIPVTPTPTVTPTLGPLGMRHFVVNKQHSQFSVVGVIGPAPLSLGGFQGQKDGQTGLPAYVDLVAGQPDSNGDATIDIVGASDYLYVDASAIAQIVLCIKPLVPVTKAGVVACNGGLDFSIALTQNHHLGQVGVNGFTAAQCTNLGGSVESPNQICGAGMVGLPCRINGDCNTSGASDGVCGLSPATCSAPDAQIGNACQADGDCDSSPGANDGTCGHTNPHPGVCNGAFVASQLGGDSGPGSASIAPVEASGLKGLPVELSIEKALPCGDEGAGSMINFALTTGTAQATILNNGDMTTICGAGNIGADCTANMDCDSAPGAGDGICGDILEYTSHGQNFSCANWQATNAPGCMVLNAPQLHGNPSGGDIITGFKFCSQ
jgi:hypothetical protein